MVSNGRSCESYWARSETSCSICVCTLATLGLWKFRVQHSCQMHPSGVSRIEFKPKNPKNVSKKRPFFFPLRFIQKFQMAHPLLFSDAHIMTALKPPNFWRTPYVTLSRLYLCKRVARRPRLKVCPKFANLQDKFMCEKPGRWLTFCIFWDLYNFLCFGDDHKPSTLNFKCLLSKHRCPQRWFGTELPDPKVPSPSKINGESDRIWTVDFLFQRMEATSAGWSMPRVRFWAKQG